MFVLEENSQLGFGKEIPRVNSRGSEIKQKKDESLKRAKMRYSVKTNEHK